VGPHRQVAAWCIAGILLLGSAAPARAACPDADTLPTAQNTALIRAATLCLLDEQRALRGLPGLRPQEELAQAADAQSADMVHRRFFDHVTPDGHSFLDRIVATGYLRPAGSWALGENLAWGTGQDSSPRQVVAAWMASPPHRQNVLERQFRDVGIGIAVGVPLTSGADGATYTTDFGSRTLRLPVPGPCGRARWRVASALRPGTGRCATARLRVSVWRAPALWQRVRLGR
jgi:uncharacterized protein YkwD